jgi:hypothetical protein
MWHTCTTSPALQRPLWFLNVHYRVHKSLPTGPILKQIKPNQNPLTGPIHNLSYTLSDQVITSTSELQPTTLQIPYKTLFSDLSYQQCYITSEGCYSPCIIILNLIMKYPTPFHHASTFHQRANVLCVHKNTVIQVGSKVLGCGYTVVGCVYTNFMKDRL